MGDTGFSRVLAAIFAGKEQARRIDYFDFNVIVKQICS